MTPRILRALAASLLAIATVTGLPSCTQPLPVSPDNATIQSAEVTAVIDGDTLVIRTIDSEARVRLIGIDTPEINRDGGPDECYAQEARSELNTLAYGRTVELHSDPSQGDVDHYGRLLRHAYIDGYSIAQVLIGTGAGHEYTHSAPYVGQAAHLTAQHAAQAAGQGLWAQCPQPPASWALNHPRSTNV